jgi:hypothetical protein
VRKVKLDSHQFYSYRFRGVLVSDEEECSVEYAVNGLVITQVLTMYHQPLVNVHVLGHSEHSLRTLMLKLA